VRTILNIEEAGVIRDHAVDSCRERSPKGLLVLDRPGEDGGAASMASLDEERSDERVVQHGGICPSAGEHAPDPSRESPA
jgi:hypothetical protein